MSRESARLKATSLSSLQKSIWFIRARRFWCRAIQLWLRACLCFTTLWTIWSLGRASRDLFLISRRSGVRVMDRRWLGRCCRRHFRASALRLFPFFLCPPADNKLVLLLNIIWYVECCGTVILEIAQSEKTWNGFVNGIPFEIMYCINKQTERDTRALLHCRLQWWILPILNFLKRLHQQLREWMDSPLQSFASVCRSWKRHALFFGRMKCYQTSIASCRQLVCWTCDSEM